MVEEFLENRNQLDLIVEKVLIRVHSFMIKLSSHLRGLIRGPYRLLIVIIFIIILIPPNLRVALNLVEVLLRHQLI